MQNSEYIYEYYEEIVKPTVTEFLNHKYDLRKGRLAAIVLDHMRDYRVIQLDIRKEGRKNATEVLMDSIKEDCFDLVLIRDVCNASKHCILKAYSPDRPEVVTPRTLTKTDNIKAEKNEGIFCAPFSESMFGESNYVFIKFDQPIALNGEMISSRFLYESIIEAVKYWDNELS